MILKQWYIIMLNVYIIKITFINILIFNYGFFNILFNLPTL